MKKQISRQRLRLDKGRKWEINKRDEKTLIGKDCLIREIQKAN